MALKIVDECICCGACVPECPNQAIYEPGEVWRKSDGTALADETENQPYSEDLFFIVSEKCTECVGFHEEPQCAAVCPVDVCVPDPDRVETEENLLEKKMFLHQA